MNKPKSYYGEVQGVVGYWYPEMDMDFYIKELEDKAQRLDKLLEIVDETGIPRMIT